MQYRELTKEAIIAEYAESCCAQTEHEKAKWGSADGMLNRFQLGLSTIEWSQVHRWIDIGCGTGVFFNVAEQAGHRFDELVGVDITEQMLLNANKRSYANPAKFICCDLEKVPDNIGSFDLMTMVGVLQQCGATPHKALSACTALLNAGGQVFITTKHLGWEEFTEGRLEPEKNHSWFLKNELFDVLEECGVEIVRYGGFLPRKGEQVTPEKSHTIYIVGRKES